VSTSRPVSTVKGARSGHPAIAYETARVSARAHVPAGAILGEKSERVRNGWLFHWLRPFDFDGRPGLGVCYCSDVATGMHYEVGYLLVDQETGWVYYPGSLRLAETLEAFDWGLKPTVTDLVVLAVQHLPRTVRLLERLGMWRVDPNWEYDCMWRIAECYTREELESRLQELPRVFPDNRFDPDAVGVFEKFDRSGCCSYELVFRSPEHDQHHLRAY